MVIAHGELIGKLTAKTKAEKPYTVLKILNRLAGHTSILTVSDYANRDWGAQGEFVTLAMFPDIYQGKAGPGVKWIACKDQDDVARLAGGSNGNGGGKSGKAGSPY